MKALPVIIAVVVVVALIRLGLRRRGRGPSPRMGMAVARLRGRGLLGDTGLVAGWDPAAGILEVRFDDRIVRYERKELDQLALAYAITVHKAQGSEYPAVVLPLTTQHAIMLQRNLLYTALTRGKKLAVIVGTEQAVAMAVHNAKPVVRYTGLKGRLLALSAPNAA